MKRSVLTLIIFSILILAVYGSIQLTMMYKERPLLTILREDPYIYVRRNFSNTLDIVERWSIDANDNYTNNALGYNNAYLISKTTSNTSSDFLAGIQIADSFDDIPPLLMNNTYIRANHGCSDMQIVTSNAHGKDWVDIGSIWQDGAGVKWHLIRIVDENTLWVLSEDANKGVSDVWSFTATLTGNLTHDSLATNTSSITVDSYSWGQLKPSAKNLQRTAFINGDIEITTDGIYFANTVELRTRDDVINPSSAMDSLVANAGTITNDAELQAVLLSGESCVYSDVTYEIQSPNGAVKIIYDMIARQQIELSYMGFDQQVVLVNTTYPNREMYIPNTLPIADDAETIWTFTSIEDYNTFPSSALRFKSPEWEDEAMPPFRMIQFLSDAGNNRQVGFSFGYDIIRGQGKDRKDLTNTAWVLFSGSGKSYPRGIDMKISDLMPNDTFNFVMDRVYFDPQSDDLSNATSLYYNEVEDTARIIFDYHTTIAYDTLTLPYKYLGDTIEVVYKSDNIVINDTKIGSHGVSVTVNEVGTYGHCVLKAYSK